MSAEEKILDKLLPDFQEVLNLRELSPYMRRAHLLTDREIEELNVDLEGQEFEAVRKLVNILKGKGASCARELANVLQQCVTEGRGGYRLVQLIGRLEMELEAAGKLQESNGARISTNGAPEGTHVPDSNGRTTFFPAALPDSLQDSKHQPSIAPATSTVEDSPRHVVLSAHAHNKHGLLEHAPMCSSNEPVQLMRYEYLKSPHQSYRDLNNLVCSLVRESKAVRSNFAGFVLRVCDLLENSKVPVEKVRLSLQYLGCFKHQPNARCQIFDGTSAISRADSITNLLGALHECSSWFNYNLVAYIAKSFGGAEGERLVEAYESQLRTYFKRLVIHCPPPSSDESHIPGGFEALEVIVDRDFRTCSLQDVAIFKSTLSTLLGLKPSVFILRAIDEVQLDGVRTKMMWSIPDCAIPYTIGQATSKTAEFTREGACSMRVGMKVLDFSPKKLQYSPGSTSYHSSNLADAKSTKNNTSSPPSLNRNASLSAQAKKAPPTVSTSPHQAFGIPAFGIPASYDKRDPKQSDKYGGSLQVLELTQSPLHKRGAYFQFYYADRRAGASRSRSREGASSGGKKKKQRLLPAQSQVVPNISAHLPQDNKPKQAIVAVRQTANEQDKPLASKDDQVPSSSRRRSRQRSQTISIRKFESSNREIGSAQSANIVSIHEESHRSAQQATSDDTQTMDIMLIAASEARRRRGRRRNRTLNNTCSPKVVNEQREEENFKLHHVPTSTPRESAFVAAEGSEPARHLELQTSHLPQPEVSAVKLDETREPVRHFELQTSRLSQPVSAIKLDKTREPARLQTSRFSQPEISAIKVDEMPVSSAFCHESFDQLHATSMHESNQSYTAMSLLELADQSSLFQSSVLSPPFTAIPPPPTESRKPVAFLWRVLGRARPNMPANIHVAAIQTVHGVRKDELQVYSGQQLKALYRIARRVFVETQEERKGFVPYSCIRISRKYYGSSSSIVQLSYSQLYVQSPDGIEDYAINSLESKPSYTEIEMVAIQDHTAVSRENLPVKCGDRVRVLYCDDSWVYGVSEDHWAGCLPRISCRLTRRSQAIFQAWNNGKIPFQADFVVKFNESPPAVLRQKPVSLVDLPAHISKVGKVLTVTRSYIPNACNNNDITIRKGLRVQVLKADGELLKVTTKSGASFWIPSSYLRPARKTSDAKTFAKEATFTLVSESVESSSPKTALKATDQCVHESIPPVNASTLVTNIASESNESSLASLKSAPSIPSLSYVSMDSTRDLMSLQSLELSFPIETSNTQ